MKKLHMLLITCTVCIAIIPQVYGADPDVMTIVNKMKSAYDTALEMGQKIEIQVKSDGKVVSNLIAGKAQKQLPSGNNVLIVLLEPERLQGFAYLYRENKDMSVDRWIYPPGINRIRKFIDPWNAYDAFLDTDFTYADIGFVQIKGEYKLLGVETLNDIPTYKVEKIPDPNARIKYYSKIITWISKENLLPVRQEFYDMTGQLYKRELFEDVFMVGKIPVPYRITMENLHTRSSTVLSIKELKTALDVPDEIFAPERLSDSATCPIWERICYPSEKARKKQP